MKGEFGGYALFRVGPDGTEWLENEGNKPAAISRAKERAAQETDPDAYIIVVPIEGCFRRVA